MLLADRSVWMNLFVHPGCVRYQLTIIRLFLSSTLSRIPFPYSYFNLFKPNSYFAHLTGMGTRIAYIVTQNSSIKRNAGAIEIRNDSFDNPIIIPARSLRSIAMYGCSQISAPALELCIQQGIQIHIMTYSGRYLGNFASSQMSDARIRLAQYRRNDDKNFVISLARSFVLAKLATYKAMLKRWQRKDHSIIDSELLKISAAQDQLQNSKPSSIEILYGIEGAASRIYFEALAKQIKPQYMNHFSFECRSRRPPRDRFNALLSFLYTVVLSDLSAALAMKGLDIQIGFLHSIGVQ